MSLVLENRHVWYRLEIISVKVKVSVILPRNKKKPSLKRYLKFYSQYLQLEISKVYSLKAFQVFYFLFAWSLRLLYLLHNACLYSEFWTITVDFIYCNHWRHPVDTLV